MTKILKITKIQYSSNSPPSKKKYKYVNKFLSFSSDTVGTPYKNSNFLAYCTATSIVLKNTAPFKRIRVKNSIWDEASYMGANNTVK